MKRTTYLFYVNSKAAGVIEAKITGSILAGVEIQSNKYKNGLTEKLPAWHRPLPFACESFLLVQSCRLNHKF